MDTYKHRSSAALVTLKRADGSPVTIRNKLNGLVAEVSNQSTANNAPIPPWAGARRRAPACT